MLERVRKNPVLQRFRKTLPVRLVRKSAGDWRYPFMLGSWWLSGVLVPRRRVSIGGVRFTLSCENWITHFRWYLFKTKEPEVIRYIDEYVSGTDIFFDIGANVGVFSVYAAKRHPGVKVYSFEPEYSNLNALKENIVRNRLTGRVRPYSAAVSDFMGLSMLHLQDTSTGAAAHTESRDNITATDEGYPVVWSEGIVSITLDELCSELGVKPTVMKIDTDGNEDKILRGGAETLSNKGLKSLVIEVPHENSEKRGFCCRALEDAGLKRAWSDRGKTRNEIWTRG